MEARTRITDNDKDAPPTPHNLRRIVAFLIMSISVGALMHSMRAFIPLYLVDHFGVGEEAAAALIALPSLAGLWAAPLGGYLSDRVGRIPVMLILCFLAGPVIYMFNFVSYGVAFGAILVIYGTINSSRAPTEEAYIIGHASPRRRSTILGIYYFSGREMGGLLTSVIGYLIDQFGFRLSITIVSVALVAVTLICSVFLWGSRD